MFGGDGPVRLAGRGAGSLARSIHAGGDEAAILARAEAWGLTAERAREVLDKWRASGHVLDIPPPPRTAPSVCVIDATDGLEDAQLLADALRATGINVHDDAPGLHVRVVPHVLAIALQAKASTSPFIAVSMREPRALISPVLVPGERGRCPRCLDTRLRHRLSAEIVGAQRVGLDVPPPHPVVHPASLAASAAAIANMLTTEDWERNVTSFDAATATMQRHPVVPVPGCPECDAGGATVRMRHLDGPLSLAAESFDDGGGGGYRTLDPEDTWDDHAHLVNDVVGLVPYVVPGPMRELRSYTSGLNAAAIDDPVAYSSRLRSGAGGKGITRSGARAGALAEALERGGLRASGGEPFRRARMSELDGAIHPNDIELFSEAQLRRAAGLEAFGMLQVPDEAGHRPVPVPFDTDAEHDWSPVADLRTGDVRWLPSSLVWFDWPGLSTGAYRGSSNGAAAGNTVEEAVLQGLLELVERDSVALWWHPMCQRPAYDLTAWDDPRIAAALAPQQALGTDVWVLDITSDLGIPAAVAVAHGMSQTTAPMMGYGAHVDPVVAVVRALTELAQMQTVLARSSTDLLHGAGAGERRWFSKVTVDSEPWLAPHGYSTPPPSPSHSTMGEAIDDVVARLERAGMTALWADASRPDVPLSVVRTYAPGMRHFWNRYAPGRLYDVPPLLGWRDAGYEEADLNPWAMIL
jgi:bacteriocin biosynthesis cyclodehydratase domain-containing protein